jgi:hypothetical protein
VALIALSAANLGCAPHGVGSGTAAETTHEPAADARPINWSMESDCAACHKTEADETDAASHPQAAAHVDTPCVGCHTNIAVLTTTHDGVFVTDTPATKMTQLTVDQQMCIGCHGTLEDVATRTEDSEALKDDQGLVVNPHLRPEGARHLENPAVCTDCHNNHSTELARDAKKYCAQCHHRGVWQCGTCHEKR